MCDEKFQNINTKKNIVFVFFIKIIKICINVETLSIIIITLSEFILQ